MSARRGGKNPHAAVLEDVKQNLFRQPVHPPPSRLFYLFYDSAKRMVGIPNEATLERAEAKK